MKAFKLNNTIEIPAIGFGTWQIEDGEKVINAVLNAIDEGYRHIDTAFFYHNEKGIGQAIKQTNVNRNQLFITTKVWNTDRGYEQTLKAFETSLQNLQLDYIDLYLIHWPANAIQFEDWKEINAQTWKALEKLYKDGKVKAIGVCNFMVNHLEALLETCEIKPMVNQIEFHPGHTQSEVVAFCKQNDILVEGWSPIGQGKILDNDLLLSIAKKYQVNVGQLCIQFALQQGILPLPKSVTPMNIKNNFHLPEFKVTSFGFKPVKPVEGIFKIAFKS